MGMRYFTKDYLDFFKELAANNTKHWFDENRKRYEVSVKQAFQHFISDLILELSQIDATLKITSRDAIFRINRDIRFSKDKSPYKLFNSAIISSKGKKDKSIPGMYLEFNPERVAVFVGLYMPNKLQLHKVRNHIVSTKDTLNKLTQNNDFRSAFGEIKGEKYKRLPREFQKEALEQELLYNKQWYFESSLSPSILLEEELMNTIINRYKIVFPILQFFNKALK